MSANNVLLLIGSPKRENSTSDSLGTYLGHGLQAKGLTVKKVHLKKEMGPKYNMQEVLGAIDNSGIVIFAVPLYVDCLPAHVIRAMEEIFEHYRAQGAGQKRLLAITNCGFPDAYNNDAATEVFRIFTRQAGFKWEGGLSLGGGSIIDGRPLENVNEAKDIKKSLDLTADALSEGKPIPEEAFKLMSRPLIPPAIPKLLVAWIGNMGFRKAAKEKGIAEQLMAKPYEK